MADTKFRSKAIALILNRYFKNKLHSPKKFARKKNVFPAPLISYSESNLWNADDNDSNWILTAGKVENLRIAAHKLNGTEVKAGNTFSFWKHIGIPSGRRGFVMGREVREGCIVPTVAGGLCQLSNALYDAALKAGFEIIERHKHTSVVKGSLAEYDRDATVKWNYVDLRFRADCDFQIVIDFTPEKLIVQFKGDQKTGNIISGDVITLKSSKLNDCYSCGNTACFKHPGEIEEIKQKYITTYILDESWPEYRDYVKSNAKEQDYFIVPFTKYSPYKTDRYSWDISETGHTKTFFLKSLQRSFSIRKASRSGRNIPSVYINYDDKIAGWLNSSVPFKSTHIVIAQNLLPFAWNEGLLWGRTFDVLMTRLPMEILQQKLDAAFLQYPGSKTLNDFRAGKELAEAESIALTKARHIITPHQQIADIFNNKSVKLNWLLPKGDQSNNRVGHKVLFPASALARKGAYEMKRLTDELNLDLVVTGKALEHEDFLGDTKITVPGPDIFADIKLVVLPAYIEHQPRILLKALSLNIPVIATAACGLSPMDGLHIVADGDYHALKNAVSEIMNPRELPEAVV